MYLTWTSTTITTNLTANAVVSLFKSIPIHEVAAFDTETTGLHILLDKPFVYQFGFVDLPNRKGYSFAIDLERYPKLGKTMIRVWHELVKDVPVYLGHNVKFDLHMCTNIGLPYYGTNLSDTQFYIRYAHDALRPGEGGPPLALKDYSAKYIDPSAKYHEKVLEMERSNIAKNLNAKLKQRLKNCRVPANLKGNYKSLTLSAINELFKDITLEPEELPEDIREAYLLWKTEDLPLYLRNRVTHLVDKNMIRYDTLNRANLIKYAHYDIIYTIEIYLKTREVIKNRQQETAIAIENSIILPLYEMERVGFIADKAYLLESKERVRMYIRNLREQMFEATQQIFSIGQHALIKDLLNTDFDLDIDSTNASYLELTLSDLEINDPDNPAIKVIKLLQELRTLEKWYSAYIIRFLKDLTFTDHLYTMINQVGAVSGRVTSDFQQFPREAILTGDGEELFHPRKIVVAPTGEYDGIVYLDYSQIELRFQAIYTILVGHPDLNLCRAYMPYKCHSPIYGSFDYNNIEHINNWDKEWYLDEEPTTRWTKTDVHGVMTTNATGLKPEDEGFKAARYEVGKRTNFAKNYGARYAKIRQMYPHKTPEECKRIDEGYYITFPGIRYYQDYCYNRAFESNTVNLFGVRYYNVSGHKLINMLIQGSAAFYLKLKIREVYDYTKQSHIKSLFQMNIHDELSWLKHKDELDIFYMFKGIMQNWNDALVPIIADMEATKTTWANKKELHSLEELQTYFSN